MANKKISELVSRTPSLTDLMLVGDPSSGYSYKTTVNDIALEVENIVAGNYVTLATAQTISGAKTFSNVFTLTSVANSPTAGSKFLILNASNAVNYRTAAEVLSDIGAQPSGSYVPTTRTLTINGTAYDLSADRTWSVGTVTSVSATAGTGISISGSPITSSGTLTITNTAPDQTVVLTSGTGINVTGTYPSFTIAATNNGTVTSVALATGTTGTDISVSGSPITSSGTITLNIPTASATNRGALSSTDWSTFNNKQGAITLTTTGSSGAATFVANTLNIPNYTLSGLGGVPTSRTLTINGTAFDLSADRSWSVGTVTSVGAIAIGSAGNDVSSSVANATTTPLLSLQLPSASASARGVLTSLDWTTFNNKQNAITLTTTGSSGAATLVGATLNVPNYTLAGLGGVSGSGTTNYIPKFTGTSAIGNSLLTDDGTTLSYGSNIASIGATNTSEKYLQFNYTAGNFFVGGTNGENYIYGAGSKPITFYTNSSERMRLDASGNLGLGTSSPSYKLDVSGTARINATTSTPLTVESNQSATFIGLKDASGSFTYLGSDDGAFLVQTPSGGYSTKLTLDNSGNLGLGVTPSAWRSTDKVLQINNSSLFDENGTNLWLGLNFYENTSGSYIYTNNGYATAYRQQTGQHNWFTAASGTAGNAISFTQAMTLDASGRLGIGVTNPSVKLNVGYTSDNRGIIQINSNAANRMAAVTFYGNNAESATIGYEGGSEIVSGGVQGDFIIRNNLNKNIILTGGNVGIGTTSPTATLEVVFPTQQTDIQSATQALTLINSSADVSGNLTGLRLRQQNGTNAGNGFFGLSSGGSTATRANMIFAPPNSSGDATERMRITSGGNVGIGISNPTNGQLQVYASSGNVLSLQKLGGAAALAFGDASTNYALFESINGGGLAVFTGNGTLSERMRITSGGAVQIAGSFTPAGTLDVNGSIVTTNGAGTTYNQFVNAGNDVIWENRQNGNIIIRSNSSTERMRINTNGEVLIGTTSDAGDYKLQVNGNSYLNGFLDVLNSRANEAAAEIKNTNTTNGYGLLVRGGVSGVSYGLKVVNAANSIDLFRVEGDGSIKTAAPSGYTAQPWKLGDVTVTSITVDTDKYISVDINGTVYNIPTCHPN